MSRTSAETDEIRVLRLSLAAVWLLTALTSLWELNGQSQALLHQAGIYDLRLARLLVIAGAGVDLLLGLALWRWPGRLSYGLAAVGMLVMTAVASWLLPSLWLDPLGPLLKNLPIAAVLWLLWARAAR